MSTEAALLGLISALRATPLAVIYGFLLGPRPARLLLAYLAAGLVVSLAVGIAVVTGFHVAAPTPGGRTIRDAVDLGLGLAALAYAAASSAGWSPPTFRRRERGRHPWTERLLQPSVPVAAAAGAVTNLPGLFYIAGLVAILETGPTWTNGVVQVLVYNLLRFLVPLGALVVVLVDPARTRRLVDDVHAWGTRHSRRLVIGLAAVVGLYLVVKGLSNLLGA
jgi:hypothetical protein